MKIFAKFFFYFHANFKKTKKVLAKISWCFPVILKWRSTRISEKLRDSRAKQLGAILPKKPGKTSLPSTAALNTYSMYVLASWGTNSTIVQSSHSQAVQL